MTAPLKRAGAIVGIIVAAIAVFFATSIVAPQASMAQSAPTILVAQAAPDEAAWGVARDSADPGVLERFIQQYPDSPFAQEAAEKLKVLGAEGGALASGAAAAAAAKPAGNTPHWIIELKDGPVDIELLPALAPKHVERIIELTEAKFYDGIVFHRVIDGFMAQSGDPTGTGMSGSDKPDVVAEFNKESFTRGAVGAARSSDPNSFNSQFFIVFGDATFLDGDYTVFGRVVSGMEAVDKITRGEPPSNPDKIVSARIEYK